VLCDPPLGGWATILDQTSTSSLKATPIMPSYIFAFLFTRISAPYSPVYATIIYSDVVCPQYTTPYPPAQWPSNHGVPCPARVFCSFLISSALLRSSTKATTKVYTAPFRVRLASSPCRILEAMATSRIPPSRVALLQHTTSEPYSEPSLEAGSVTNTVERREPSSVP
jgi:hypothetical protein